MQLASSSNMIMIINRACILYGLFLNCHIIFYILHKICSKTWSGWCWSVFGNTHEQ